MRYMGVKIYLFILLLFAIILTSCSAQTTTTCPQTDCPKLDCASCPVKTETKVETKTITNTVYVCLDLREMKNKEDCLKINSEGWYEVKTFSGSSDRTTETFRINSKQWRYTLTCAGQNQFFVGYNLEISKLVEDKPTQVKFITMEKCESKREPNYVYDGPGDYFFDFNAANIDSWTIKVEAQK